MKRRRALLFPLIVVLALCAVCGVWLDRERRQYALNRAFIAALLRNDSKTALALVNERADPNTPFDPPPVPALQLVLDHLLHRKVASPNVSPTALMWACGERQSTGSSTSTQWVTMAENLPLLKAMLAHGAKVNVETLDGSTALRIAVFEKRVHTVELLLQHGADVNGQNIDGNTPLIRAALTNDGDIVHLLLSYGAKPNVQNARGEAALHYAIQLSTDATGVIPDLLAHGADTNAKNKNGETPLQLAQKAKRPDLVRLLKQHSAK